MRRTRTRVHGAACVELVLVLGFGLLPLALGILQISLALCAHHTLNLAALLAVRAGSVAQADPDIMRRRLATGLVALYLPNDQDPARDAGALLQAQLQALADLELFGAVRMVSPTAAMADDFAIRRSGQRVIPNDALQVRSQAMGAASGVSLQSANVLEVEFTYCLPMIVPLVDVTLSSFLSLLDADTLHRRCYADRRLPLVSHVRLPMQSDARSWGTD
ncbi:MAG: hypothetical protein QM718_01510 [Steroidobacteraceae bacterium]